jgi:hypothetical protein
MGRPCETHAPGLPRPCLNLPDPLLHSHATRIARVGAYSADRLEKPWPATVYRALAALHNATGMAFIIGVNQHAEDAELTREQVARTERLLPRGAVASFAVG